MGREARAAVGDYQHLIVERRGPVGWLINNRADQLNAMASYVANGYSQRDIGVRNDRDPVPSHRRRA